MRADRDLMVKDKSKRQKKIQRWKCLAYERSRDIPALLSVMMHKYAQAHTVCVQ